MRYVIQLLIPALVIIVVVLVMTRNRPSAPPQSPRGDTESSDSGPLSTGTFIAILVIGAVFTVALVYALHVGSD
jgi:hypothetical protein